MATFVPPQASETSCPGQGPPGNDLDGSLPLAQPGTVREAEDELILIFKRMLNGTGDRARAIAIDPDDNVWVGYQSGAGYEVWKLDGDDGRVLVRHPVPGAQYTYAMMYEGGRIWLSDANLIRRIDATTGAITTVTGTRATNLGVVIPRNNTQMLVTGVQAHSPSEFVVIDKNTAQIVANIGLPGGSTDTRGIAVDQTGGIWVASRGLWASGPYRVYHYRADGTYINEFYTGDRPCGIGLDSNGFVWVTHVGTPGTGNGAWTTVIDPVAANGQGAIVGYVGLGTGSYNYSDGTGATTSQIARDGEWRIVFDSFRPNLKWGIATWDADVPSQTSLEVFARAANTKLGLSNATFFEYAFSGDDPMGQVQGRYVEMRVRLARAEGTPPDLSPALRSLTLRYAKGTVSGVAGLGNWLPEQYPNADFILRPVGGGANTAVSDIQLGPFGAFAFTTTLRGSYQLLAKSSHWLQQRLTVPLNITDDGSHGNVFALLNGDIDEDNEIAIGDYAILSVAFGATPGDPNWNPNADVDGDQEVAISDFSILSSNFGLVGDE